MREIKFRGKRIDNEEWVYGMNIMQLKPAIDSPPTRVFIAQSDSKITWFDNTDTGEEMFKITNLEVIPETVGMWTGLKDRKGKEIYEGDVYAYDNPNFGYGGNTPAFLKDTIRSIEELYFDDMIQWRLDCCEVIGTIHDEVGK